MSRLRWFILLLGPLPIVGSSWAVSAWFQTGNAVSVVRNDVVRAPEVPLLADASPAPRRTRQGSQALERECQQTAERWRKQLGAECQIVVRSPFVLAGDMSAEELVAWHDNTIAPAVRAMRHCYFRTDPTEPVSVLMFRGEQSYNDYCQRLFKDSGISIYGYYKPQLRTLVLNLGTGSGTLLHELTHALIDFDFPEAPVWLNEGLASLHEQCRFRHDDSGPWIEGLVNWRLSGLQEAAREGKLRPLSAMIENREFRGPLVGINYAQARYFCLFMQERGVLAEFFRTVRAHKRDDPRGLRSIAQVFPDQSLEEVNRKFERWIIELSPAR